MKRTAGSLTHKDFGKYVEAPGNPEGRLWGVQHAAVTDGSAEPFTRLLLTGHGGVDVGTKGIPPETPVDVRETSKWESR